MLHSCWDRVKACHLLYGKAVCKLVRSTKHGYDDLTKALVTSVLQLSSLSPNSNMADDEDNVTLDIMQVWVLTDHFLDWVLVSRASNKNWGQIILGT